MKKGFKKTGTCLYNTYIFINDDFLPSFVTDHPEPANFAYELLNQDHPASLTDLSINL